MKMILEIILWIASIWGVHPCATKAIQATEPAERTAWLVLLLTCCVAAPLIRMHSVSHLKITDKQLVIIVAAPMLCQLGGMLSALGQNNDAVLLFSVLASWVAMYLLIQSMKITFNAERR